MADLGRGAGVTVTHQMDADLLMGILGDVGLVLNVGRQMEAAIVDNNTVRIYDGVVVSQGRDLHIVANNYDDFTIENGSQSETRYDIIGYHLYKEDGKEYCENFVQKDVGESGTVTEQSLREGAGETYISMYKVKLEGLTITELIPMYAKIQMPMKDMLSSLPEESGSITLDGDAAGCNVKSVSGIYYRIGRLCWFEADISLGNSGSSDTVVQIPCLPYAPARHSVFNVGYSQVTIKANGVEDASNPTSAYYAWAYGGYKYLGLGYSYSARNWRCTEKDIVTTDPAACVISGCYVIEEG